LFSPLHDVYFVIVQTSNNICNPSLQIFSLFCRKEKLNHHSAMVCSESKAITYQQIKKWRA